MSSDDFVDYQRQAIRLNKSYSDYDDYKNDPNNLAPEEIGKVQNLVHSAPIATLFASRREMTRAVFRLKFPGYGLSSFGEKTQTDGSVLALYGVHIPKSGHTRYLLFRGRGGSYTLLDDFAYPDTAGIEDAVESGDKLLYSGRQGAKVVERSPSVK